MGRMLLAFVLLCMSLFLDHYSGLYAFFWWVGFAPVEVIDGLRFAGAGLFLWVLIHPYRIKVFG